MKFNFKRVKWAEGAQTIEYALIALLHHFLRSSHCWKRHMPCLAWLLCRKIVLTLACKSAPEWANPNKELGWPPKAAMCAGVCWNFVVLIFTFTPHCSRPLRQSFWNKNKKIIDVWQFTTANNFNYFLLDIIFANARASTTTQLWRQDQHENDVAIMFIQIQKLKKICSAIERNINSCKWSLRKVFNKKFVLKNFRYHTCQKRFLVTNYPHYCANGCGREFKENTNWWLHFDNKAT